MPVQENEIALDTITLDKMGCLMNWAENHPAMA